ncbi:hypothetical protein G6F56_004556 [Rhizopus delemar]|nr:hypothetical protein G6F56_004556 [Rhizopus delemar]
MPLIPPALPTLNNLVFHPIALIKSFACFAFGLNRIYGSSKDEYKEFSFGNAEVDDDAGYRAIQATRPYTLSYGLTDSPVGLLSCLMEKYHDWKHNPKDKDKVSLPGTISSKEFLTQISIYWMSNTISSSIRLYYESFNQNEHHTAFASPVNIPLGVSVFASELAKLPKEWLDVSSQLVQYNEYESGGHFASLEEPQLLLSDIQMFGKKTKDIFL